MLILKNYSNFSTAKKARGEQKKQKTALAYMKRAEKSLCFDRCKEIVKNVEAFAGTAILCAIKI